MSVELIWDLPPPSAGKPSPLTLVLTHGAGMPATSETMNTLARLIARQGIAVARFNFPYMQRAQETGRRPWPPDPDDVLTATYIQVIQQFAAKGVPPARLAIGGRSMGGRVAARIADPAEVAALIPISYPFHPPNDPTRAKTAHLQTIATPTLIVQGERDEYGTRSEVEGYDLSPNISLEWIPDGNHGLVPRKRSGHTVEGNLRVASAAIAEFIQRLR